jgi:hypothetical protein
MNKMTVKQICISIYAVVMLIAFIVISVQLHSLSKKMSKETISTSTNTITRYVPTPAKIISVPLPAKIDSQTVIRNYYNKVVYRDTAMNNKQGKVILTDTIYNNTILSRKVDVDLVPPVVRNNRFSVFTVAGIKNVSLMGCFQFKKMQIMGGYDFVNKAPVAGFGLQLFNW